MTFNWVGYDIFWGVPTDRVPSSRRLRSLLGWNESQARGSYNYNIKRSLLRSDWSTGLLILFSFGTSS